MDTKLNMKWCMEMFPTLDNILIDFILMTYKWVQKQDTRMDMVEEKTKILVAWFNKVKMNGGTLPSSSSRFSLEHHFRHGEMTAPLAIFKDSCAFPTQDSVLK